MLFHETRVNILLYFIWVFGFGEGGRELAWHVFNSVCFWLEKAKPKSLYGRFVSLDWIRFMMGKRSQPMIR